MLKILLTGSQGQVGSAIRALVENTQIDNISLFAYSRAECDIAERSAVNKLMINVQPDVVINAAAYTAVDKAEEDVLQAEKINSEAVENLALVCRDLNIPILHISTDYVFDGMLPSDSAYKETDVTNPLGVYGKTKLMGEEKIQDICQKYIILRTSWVFSKYGNNFVKTMLKLFQQKESLSIVADQYGGPTSADAIARSLLIIASKVANDNLFDQWGVYHYTGQPIVSWCDFAKKISELNMNQQTIIKSITPITTEQFGARAARPKNSKLDLSKIKQIFNIEPCDWQKDLLLIIDSLSTDRYEASINK